MPDVTGKIDKPDFRGSAGNSNNDERTHLIRGSQSVESLRQSGQHSLRSGHFFEDVAEGIQERDRQRLKREVSRYVSFVWALVCSGCAGSITAYSLYGPLFLSRLHYTQYRVNLVSIIAEIAIYFPIPIVGFINDRYGPRKSCLLAAIFFGLGYYLAAFGYNSGPPKDTGGHGWPFGVMVFSFVCVGLGTGCLHMAGLTTCAKNFGRGKHKGFAVSAPIAAFGLSGFWQSQVGSRLLYERTPDGSRGDVDVFRFFIFLASLLTAVGLIGFLLLRIVDEDEIIEEAIEELERSGLLEDSEFFHSRSQEINYGTVTGTNNTSEVDMDTQKRKAEDEARRKTMLLNQETKAFLADHTMWWLAAGFFLVTGPGEAFINNLGTIIGTLYPSPATEASGPSQPLPWTPPATHVSIVAITSTLARLAAGTTSDLLAPLIPQHQHRRGPASLTSSLASLDPLADSTGSLPRQRRFTISRMTFLLAYSVLLSVGFVVLASGAVQDHAADRFWLVSALSGIGYGSAFSLVPLIISCVWGVENFATNFGIVAVAPAFGAAMWGIIYAAEYESGSKQGDWGGVCYGLQCYRFTFWGMAGAVWIALVLWVMAWKGPGGWKKRGIAV